MTDKEIQKAKETIPKWHRGKPSVLTPEQKQLDRELWCREMINSILCYDGKANLINDRYLKDYIIELGLPTVQRLCEEQIADFEKATVKKNVATDCDGISYNSIVWADEQ